MVEREHDQGQETMVWKKKHFILGTTHLILFRDPVSLTVTRS
jgi:hypothetical protein